MAVEKHSLAASDANPRVRDYWPRYRKRAFIGTVLMQIALAVVIAAAILTVGGVSPLSLPFITTILAFIVASIGGNVILVRELTTPLKNLLDALTHVSGEPTDIIPPNPNARANASTGLKPALQLIYQLSSGKDNSGHQTVNKELASKTGEIVDQNSLGAQLADMLNHSSAGIAILDKRRQIIYHNTLAPVITNSDGAPQINLDFNQSNAIDDWLNKAEDSIHSETVWQRIADKPLGEDGRKIYDIYASYQKGSDATCMLIFIDKTDIYQPEDENLNFLAVAAHELRGPITVIRGYLDVLEQELEPNLSGDQKVLIDRLTVSANRLSTYVNNILSTARYDRHHLQTHLTESRLSDIYNSVQDDMELRASSQTRLLNVDIPANLPTVAADTAGIGEVLSNLIDNAIKYSPEGGTVNVFAQKKDDSVEVRVQDHGIGMPSNVVGQLFSKFYRSHRSRETVNGTGIGLYLSRAIIESHGGQIGVTSIEGKGSTFSFTLPIYSTVAEKIQTSDNGNESLITTRHGWIKNHSMYKS